MEVSFRKEIASLEDRLVSMEARYTPDHPDVIKLKAMIEQLKKSRDTSANPKPKPVEKAQPAVTPEPREIQQLRSQLHALEESIASYKLQQVRLTQQAKSYEAHIQMSPVVEQEYKQVTRDYKTALDFYNELLAKKNASGMAGALQTAAQGEQFRVLDQASLPETPSFPVLWMFGAGGAGGGLSLGLVLVLLLEFRDKAMRTERDVEFFLELPTLVLLPSVGMIHKQKNARWRRWGKKGKKTAVLPAGV